MTLIYLSSRRGCAFFRVACPLRNPFVLFSVSSPSSLSLSMADKGTVDNVRSSLSALKTLIQRYREYNEADCYYPPEEDSGHIQALMYSRGVWR